MLLGCGGGGGGAAGGGTGGGGETPPATSGLLPPAAVPGATLYPQASALRPLRDGARYVYRRQDFTTNQVNEVVIRQSAGTGATIVETDSTTGVEPGTVSLDERGAVVSVGSFRIIEGSPLIPLVAVELPSPVRRNEHITVFDQRVTASAIDVDGDGRTDPVDVAIWRVVGGDESVSLPNLDAAQTALRVDTFFKLRFNPSSGAAPINFESQLLTWYLPGVGVIRQAKAGTGGRVFDEETLLLGYDGVDRGLGYSQREVIAGTLESLVARGDQLFALAQNPTNWQVLRMDRFGRLLSRSDAPFSDGTWRGLFALPAGLRLLRGSDMRYQLMTVTDEGTVSSAPDVVVDLNGGRSTTLMELNPEIVAAPGGDRIWFVWQRYYGETSNTSSELVVRSIDAAGTLSAEQRFPIYPSFDGLSIAARPGGGLALTWQESDGLGNARNRWLNLDNSGNVIADVAYGELSRPIAGQYQPVWRPVVDATRQWLTWPGPDSSGSPGRFRHAVSLDANGRLIGTGSDVDALQAAVLSPLNGNDDPQNTMLWTVADTRWLMQTSGTGPVADGVSFSGNWLRVIEFDIGAGPLPATAKRLADYRIPLQPRSMFGAAPVAFESHFLVTTAQGGDTVPVVIWRR